MKIEASTVEEYLEKVPEKQKAAMAQLRATVKENIPHGFEEMILYSMPGYVVPLSTYPPGYHCQPNSPLPFINIAAQKHFIALYHSCIYANTQLHDWFVEEYKKLDIGKLDMGKSCIRFKNYDKIPYELIAQLCQKVTVEKWIELYEKAYK